MPRRTSRFNPDGWIGEQLSVGANSERFFGGIRVDGEVFNVGDFVLVKVESYGDTQVMKIDALFEDMQEQKFFEGRWYYPPEDTTCGRLVGHDPREVFETVHVDELLIECIDGHCTVMEWDAYQQWLDQPATDDDNHEDETTFVCRAAYHPGSGEFVPLTGASSLAEAARGAGSREQQQAGQQQPPLQQNISAKQRGKRPAGMVGMGAHAASGNFDSSNPSLWAAALDGENDGAATARVAQRKRRRLGRFAEAASRLAPSAAPERMPCREKERDEVIGVLRSAILEGALGGSLYLSGTPGTGKTATVHQALRALASERGLPSFRTIFVNGMKLSSPYDVYSLLWEALTGQAAKPARALELLEKRFASGTGKAGGGGREGGAGAGGAVMKRRSAQGQKVILVLDELDYLVTGKQSVIYNLFEWATRGSSHMLVVGISNTMVSATAIPVLLGASALLAHRSSTCLPLSSTSTRALPTPHPPAARTHAGRIFPSGCCRVSSRASTSGASTSSRTHTRTLWPSSRIGWALWMPSASTGQRRGRATRGGSSCAPVRSLRSQEMSAALSRSAGLPHRLPSARRQQRTRQVLRAQPRAARPSGGRRARARRALARQTLAVRRRWKHAVT